MAPATATPATPAAPKAKGAGVNPTRAELDKRLRDLEAQLEQARAVCTEAEATGGSASKRFATAKARVQELKTQRNAVRAELERAAGGPKASGKKARKDQASNPSPPATQAQTPSTGATGDRGGGRGAATESPRGQDRGRHRELAEEPGRGGGQEEVAYGTARPTGHGRPEELAGRVSPEQHGGGAAQAGQQATLGAAPAPGAEAHGATEEFRQQLHELRLLVEQERQRRLEQERQQQLEQERIRQLQQELEQERFRRVELERQQARAQERTLSDTEQQFSDEEYGAELFQDSSRELELGAGGAAAPTNEEEARQQREAAEEARRADMARRMEEWRQAAERERRRTDAQRQGAGQQGVTEQMGAGERREGASGVPGHLPIEHAGAVETGLGVAAPLPPREVAKGVDLPKYDGSESKTLLEFIGWQEAFEHACRHNHTPESGWSAKLLVALEGRAMLIYKDLEQTLRADGAAATYSTLISGLRLQLFPFATPSGLSTEMQRLKWTGACDPAEHNIKFRRLLDLLFELRPNYLSDQDVLNMYYQSVPTLYRTGHATITLREAQQEVRQLYLRNRERGPALGVAPMVDETEDMDESDGESDVDTAATAPVNGAEALRGAKRKPPGRTDAYTTGGKRLKGKTESIDLETQLAAIHDALQMGVQKGMQKGMEQLRRETRKWIGGGKPGATAWKPPNQQQQQQAGQQQQQQQQAGQQQQQQQSAGGGPGTCWRCGQHGHRKRDCKNAKRRGAQENGGTGH